ncbi:MFS transporter, partial [Burkholderia pseudomallei]
MNACVFGLLIMSVDGLGHGERGALVAAELAVAFVVGYFFVKRQLSQPAPLLPVDLMRIPVFALSIGTSIASFTSQMLAFVALPFWLQHSLGFSQVQTGLYMTPWPLVIVVAAPLAGVLSDRYSAGVLGGIGLALFAAGLLSLAMIGADPGTGDIVWRMALCGADDSIARLFGDWNSPK